MNHRSEPTDNDGTGSAPENISRRVRALHARAEHESTPAPEREAARKLASELLKKHSFNQEMPAAAGQSKDKVVSGAHYKHSARQTRSRRIAHAAIWVRHHVIELVVVGGTAALAVTVWVWFAALSALLAAWWAAVEYRVSRNHRE